MEEKNEIVEYPPTLACKRYLELRKQYKDEYDSRKLRNVISVFSSTSGLTNAIHNEDNMLIDFARTDCMITALSYFAAKKAVVNGDLAHENTNGLTK